MIHRRNWFKSAAASAAAPGVIYGKTVPRGPLATISPVTQEPRRYAILLASSLFRLSYGAGGAEGLGVLAGVDKSATAHSCDQTVYYRIIPGDPSREIHATVFEEGRQVGLSAQLMIGTVDEIVEHYRRLLEAAIRLYEDHDQDGAAADDRAQQAAGIREFRVMPNATPEQLGQLAAHNAAVANTQVVRQPAYEG